MDLRVRLLTFAIAAGLLLSGCTSGFTRIAPRPPDKFERLGRVEGSACGAMLLLGTAYYFIPVNLNERVANAYQDALSKAPGASGLINVTYQENWYWWVIGTTRCTKISGEAVKDFADLCNYTVEVREGGFYPGPYKRIQFVKRVVGGFRQHRNILMPLGSLGKREDAGTGKGSLITIKRHVRSGASGCCSLLFPISCVISVIP